jgi:hypothetical protein
VLPEEAQIATILDRGAHLRLRALMIDLEMYKTQWKTGTNEWKIGENLIEVPNQDPTHDPDHTSTVPYMSHTTLTLKRPSAKSYEATEG